MTQHPPTAPLPQIVSNAAGRLRMIVPQIRSNNLRAVAVEESIGHLPGIRSVYAYPRTGSVVVWYSPQRCHDIHQIQQAALNADQIPDHTLPHRLPRSADSTNSDITRITVGGVALSALGIRRYLLGGSPLLSPRAKLITTGITIFLGSPFLGRALQSFRKKKPGTDTLVTAATIASLVLSENIVALVVLWLLNIGEFLQELTLRRTRQAISDLLTGTQGNVWIRTNEGAEIQVPIDTLRVGDLVIVHDHSAIPIDGEIIEGQASIDQSAITGETLPISSNIGTKTHAGSVVIRGRIVIRATAVGSDTVIGRIISRVEQAQQDRAPIQTVGERFSQKFVPLSFGLSALTLLITRDVRRAMTMLLIACPCAVGLSTPTAISAAIGNGARRGILIKGGSYLEQSGQINAIVIDKTGTLTIGRPVVTNVVALHPHWQPEQILAYAASSELHSPHPLAAAVIRSTEERCIHIPAHETCEILVGLGIRTNAEGKTFLLGNPALLRSEGIEINAEAEQWITRLREDAEIPLLLAIDGILVGIISLRDTVRPEARSVIAQLRQRGIDRIIMLTGDHPQTAHAIAQELGITEWRAEVLPEDKFTVVHQLKQQGYTVCMVGDGVNDAPALAEASLGIAMGVTGTDVAVETADIALVNDDLERLVDICDLGNHTINVIRQNYGMSIGINTLGLILSATGYLSPIAAAILHNASSIAVAINSSRLIHYQLSGHPPQPLNQQ